MLDVVIYEEDLLTRSLMQEWLRDAGFGVRIGSTCNALRDAPGDVVVVNVSSPKQRGPQCLHDIRAAHAGRPMIAISAQFRPGLAAAGTAAMTLGVQQVIAKPLMQEELLRAVRAVASTPVGS
jgi:DNA-binding NtrC family response regulator